jgi:Family of unknown function (DUF6510)
MTMTAPIWLDGNAMAGLLGEVFGAEMTTAQRGCHSCGAHNAVGAHRAYPAAGAVLRCPVCNAVALRIVRLPQRDVVQLTGSWTLDIPRR